MNVICCVKQQGEQVDLIQKFSIWSPFLLNVWPFMASNMSERYNAIIQTCEHPDFYVGV